MSNKDRLKSAYENVAYCADETWTNDTDPYQRANLALFVHERKNLNYKILQLRPRTVEDCIPNSKLAKYNNFSYCDARELSYSPNLTKNDIPIRFSDQFKYEAVVEPWMHSEIDDLYFLFLYCQNNSMDDPYNPTSYPHLNYSHRMQDTGYESPFLNANNFDESLLKMAITSDRTRDIWNSNTEEEEDEGDCPTVNNHMMSVCNFSEGHLFLPKDKFCEEHRIFSAEREPINDFRHLKQLSTSFKEQNSWILKCSRRSASNESNDSICEYASSKEEARTEKRLYSAVLQGISANKGSLSRNGDLPILAKQVGGDETKRLDSTVLGGMASSTIITASSSSVNSEDKFILDGRNQVVNPSGNIFVPNVNKGLVNQNSFKIVPKVEVADVSTPSNCLTSYSSFISTNNFIPPPISSPVNSSFANTCSQNHSSHYINNYSHYQISHFSNSIPNSCFSHLITNRNIQTLSRPGFLPSTYPFSSSVLMLQQNRSTTVYPASPYLQQLYSPVSFPRSIQNFPQNFARSSLPQRSFSSPLSSHFVPQPPTHWILQNQHSTSQHATDQAARNKAKCKKLICQPAKSKARSQTGSLVSVETEDAKQSQYKKASNSENINPGADSSSVIADQPSDDYKEVVSKTVEVLFEDIRSDTFVPITVSLSEELEIQALEQYNSSDNVYQELERQAAEQYNECSENWRSPPNSSCVSCSGGLSLRCNLATVFT